MTKKPKPIPPFNVRLKGPVTDIDVAAEAMRGFEGDVKIYPVNKAKNRLVAKVPQTRADEAMQWLVAANWI